MLYAGMIALMVPDDVRPTDIIVVLGGDGAPRAVRAAALFRAGAAPRVLVSGTGDCRAIRDAMTERGVPLGAILIECRSRSTFQNAAWSAPILARAGVRRAILVTSWFHMRRALACFSLAAPEISWGTAAVPPIQSRGISVSMLAEAPAVLEEWIKLGWYAVRYGVLPSSIRRSRAP